MSGAYIIDKKKPVEDEHIILRQIDFQIDISRRVVYFVGDVDIDTPAFINQRLDAICDLTNNYKSPIDIDITSPGGDVYGMLGAVDVIQNALVPINTLGRGMVMSAATFLLIAGTGARIMTPNSILMIHEISGWVSGSTKDIIAEADHIKKLQKMSYDLYGKFSKKSSAYWKKRIKSNLYLEADECLELGLIDKIGM